MFIRVSNFDGNSIENLNVDFSSSLFAVCLSDIIYIACVSCVISKRDTRVRFIRQIVLSLLRKCLHRCTNGHLSVTVLLLSFLVVCLCI